MSFTKNLNKLLYIVSLFCSLNLTVYSYDWESIRSKTNPRNCATQQLFARPDWERFKTLAKDGDVLAQYEYGDKCIGDAGKLTNGERIQKRFEGYMFLLISAIYGEYDFSKDAFDYIGKIDDLTKESPISDFITRAQEFAEKE